MEHVRTQLGRAGLILLLLGCPPKGLPTQLEECPDDSVTWADAEPVFAEHCTRCHSSTLPDGARSGAPLLINFDTPEAALMQDFVAWTQITTGRMPIGATLPDEDALVIWSWLSCGGPP